MPDKNPTELNVPLLQDAVLETLRERLLDGTFPPGSQLNIREVAARFGVSAVPVREAIKILQSEGRLVHDRGRGYSVRRLTHEELVQVNHLSALIEAELLKAGVPKLKQTQIAEMRKVVEIVCAEDGDNREVLDAHRRLHFIPYEAADLSVFLEVVTRLWDQYEHYRLLFFDSDSSLKASGTEAHRNFVDACADSDTERALAIHAEHRTSSFHYLAHIAESGTVPL